MNDKWCVGRKCVELKILVKTFCKTLTHGKNRICEINFFNTNKQFINAFSQNMVHEEQPSFKILRSKKFAQYWVSRPFRWGFWRGPFNKNHLVCFMAPKIKRISIYIISFFLKVNVSESFISSHKGKGWFY